MRLSKFVRLLFLGRLHLSALLSMASIELQEHDAKGRIIHDHIRWLYMLFRSETPVVSLPILHFLVLVSFPVAPETYMYIVPHCSCHPTYLFADLPAQTYPFLLDLFQLDLPLEGVGSLVCCERRLAVLLHHLPDLH